MSGAMDMDELYARICHVVADEGLYLEERLSLDRLAREVSSNRTYVTRALGAKSVTFNQLVNSFRARHAIDYIMSRDCRGVSLIEIAEASGFSSCRTMNRYIKQSAGFSACALISRLYGP